MARRPLDETRNFLHRYLSYILSYSFEVEHVRRISIQSKTRHCVKGDRNRNVAATMSITSVFLIHKVAAWRMPVQSLPNEKYPLDIYSPFPECEKPESLPESQKSREAESFSLMINLGSWPYRHIRDHLKCQYTKERGRMWKRAVYCLLCHAQL